MRQIIGVIRKRGLLIIAVILAIVSTYFIYQSLRPSDKEKIQMVTVVVATKDIDADKEITDEMLQEVQRPRSDETGYMVSRKSDVVGKYTKFKIFANEYIRKERISAEKMDKYGTAEREYRIKVDNISYGGVSGGSHADILWTGLALPTNTNGNTSNKDKKDPQLTVGGVIFENVEVIKVLNEYNEDVDTLSNDKYNKSNHKADIVVLSVSQEQAVILDILKQYSEKEIPFMLAKYTEKSKEQGKEKQFIKIEDVFKLNEILRREGGKDQ